jgi:hypothetical protein
MKPVFAAEGAICGKLSGKSTGLQTKLRKVLVVRGKSVPPYGTPKRQFPVSGKESFRLMTERSKPGRGLWIKGERFGVSLENPPLRG